MKWTALTIFALLVVGTVALVIAYWLSENDCEERHRAEEPMKAIVYREYGGPEVLHIEDIEKPAPTDEQVLVRVQAASLNPYDMHFLHGTPYFMRLSAGLRKPKFTGIGVDFSGTVESVGKNVTGFKPGDAVFGGRQGALAEYLVIAEQGLVKKPDNIGFEQAGAVNIAAGLHRGWHALRPDHRQHREPLTLGEPAPAKAERPLRDGRRGEGQVDQAHG